jgi:hypothetical protein
MASDLDDEEILSDPGAACRRAAERLLKVCAYFYWDSLYQNEIQSIVINGFGQFEAKTQPPKDWDRWIMTRDLGALNYLLRTLSEYITYNNLNLKYLGKSEVWEKNLFSLFDSFAQDLNLTVHDKQEGPEVRRRRQLKRLEDVLKKIDNASIVLPKSIQFFRKIEDKHGIHYESYDQNGDLVRFFECSCNYELHQPYMYLSPTNPSAIDAVCVPLRFDLTKPV